MKKASNIRFCSRFFINLIICVSIYNISWNVSAQAPTDLFGMSLEDVLNMEVSTASKLGGKASESPGHLVVVTQEDIRRYGYRTVGEAMERAAGIISGDNGSATSVVIRGINPSDFTTASRILFLIDGMRYNDFAFDQAFVNESFPLDIESIDRIEILKGAGSAIWGSNGLIAVVNVISKDGGSTNNKKALLEYGSKDRSKGYASWGGKTEGGVKYFSSLSATHVDGRFSLFRPSTEEDRPWSSSTERALDKQLYRGNLKASYEGVYTNVTYGLDDLSFGADPTGASEEFEFGPTRAELGYKTKIWQEQNGELLVKANYFDDPFFQQFSFGDPSAGFTGFAKQDAQLKSGGSSIQYSQDIFEDFKALAGIEWTRVYKLRFDIDSNFFDSTGAEIPGFSTSKVVNNYRTMAGYFFDLNYKPVDQLSVFAGGRLDQASELDSVFGPRGSIVYMPEKETTVKLMYSEGFRNPAISESYIYPSDPQKVEAERLQFYEALVEQRVSESLIVTGAVFYNDLSDVIGLSTVEDLTSYYKNFEGYTSQGAELEAKLKIAEALEGYTNYTYVEAENKSTSGIVFGSPRNIGRTGLSWNYKDLLMVSPELMYGSSSLSFSGYKFDSYLITNINIIGYPVHRDASIALKIENVFNDRFARESGFGVGAEAGREVRVAATYHF